MDKFPWCARSVTMQEWKLAQPISAQIEHTLLKRLLLHISEHYIWLSLTLNWVQRPSACSAAAVQFPCCISRLHSYSPPPPTPTRILLRPIAVELYGSDQSPRCHSSWSSSTSPPAWEASSPRPSTAEMHSRLSWTDKRLHKSTLAAHDQAAYMRLINWVNVRVNMHWH